MAKDFPLYDPSKKAKELSAKGAGGEYTGEQQLKADIQDFEDGVRENLAAFKEDIEGQLAPIPRFSIDVVDELPPAAEASPTTIYMVEGEGKGSSNIYAEYVFIDGKAEFLGNVESSVDLSQYYTKAEVYSKAEVDAKLGSLILR